MGMAGILFGILFLSLLIGVPIAISLGVAASLTMMLTNNAQYLASIPTRMFTQLDSFTLMAVPFFILAGNIMAEGGISDRLISFFELLLKRLPGRLSCICVVASGFFGAISGSNPATVAAIGGICAPKMIEKGYSREDAAGCCYSAFDPDGYLRCHCFCIRYCHVRGRMDSRYYADHWSVYRKYVLVQTL